jgi:pyrroline-5-carboxylate reductase
MNESPRLAVIGAGSLGRAIVRGLLTEGVVAPERVVVTTRRPERAVEAAAELGVGTAADNRTAVEDADVVLLAVKPQIMQSVVTGLSLGGRLVISVAAGVRTDQIEAWAPPDTRVVRAMPNTPVQCGAAATAIAPGSWATDADVDRTEAWFRSVGRTVRVEEGHLDAVTGLSGSGPAYVFLILEALSDAGVKVGLSREVAQELAAQTLLGAAQMLIETGEHPGRLKDRVTSPGGTAIAGLHVLEAGGLRTTLMNAVEAATARARELADAGSGSVGPTGRR